MSTSLMMWVIQLLCTRLDASLVFILIFILKVGVGICLPRAFHEPDDTAVGGDITDHDSKLGLEDGQLPGSPYVCLCL